MSEHVAVKNAADRKQVRNAQRSDEQLERERAGYYRDVMKTYAGRYVMWDRQAPIYRSSFDPHGTWMAFKCGEQDSARELQALLLRHCPAEYLAMEREARERQAKTDAEREAFQIQRAAERQSE